MFFLKYKTKPTYDISSIIKFESKKVNLILETDMLEDNAFKKLRFLTQMLK